MIVILLLVGTIAAVAFCLVQKPQFSATSKVFVSTQSGGSAADLVQGSTFTVQRVITYSTLVTTPIVLAPVIETLGLSIPVSTLESRVVATAPVNTSIIEITVTDSSPSRAANIANATSRSLTSVVQSIETPDTSGASSPVKLTIAQEATVPTRAVSPNVPLDITLGALIGLFVGIIIAVLRHSLDTRIRNERDVEQLTDVPIIGGIVFDPKAYKRPLIVQVDPHSPRAESFRTLRTNLQFLDIDIATTARSFVVTSSIEREGKSTSAANLAITLSDAGSRVLLVDADLRRPKLADYMGVEGVVGLTDVLIGQAELNDTIQPWGTAKLFVLPAGQIPPNPSELLGSKHMTNLIAEFSRTFDFVVFDSPPLLPVTDAAILAKNLGGAIMIVAAGRTHKNQLRGALSNLAKVDATIAGIVVTMLPTKGPDAYGYRGYTYGAISPKKSNRLLSRK